MNHRQSCVAGGCLGAFMVVAVAAYAWINAGSPTPANAGQPAKIDPAAPMPMFGGSPSRNMVNLIDKNIPVTWNVEEGKQKNIKWVAAVGSKAYGGPVIADGKVFVGTNNENPRNPKISRDKGKKAVLMAFAEADGKFLWQIVHDFPDNPAYEMAMGEGLCSTPVVEGKRLYYLAPGTVVCADTAGTVKWTYDLEKELGVVPHHIGNCSPLIVGDLVMVVTGNGVDEEGKVVNPKAPSFIAINKNTGKLKWQSNLPGENIIEGQWTNPTLAVVNGKPQVIFPGGDCVLYSFEPESGDLIWKCNLNPERKKGKKVENYIIATPVVVGDRLYVGIGCYPEHPLPARPYGYVLCVDVTKKGDVSPKNYNVKDAANKQSALVWAFGGMIDPPPKGRGREVYFGHTISTACVHDGLVFMAENLGYIHCLDAKTGERYWFYDTKSSFWGSPYYVDGNIYVNADDGDVYIFKCDKKRQFYANGKLHQAPGEKDKIEGAANMDEASLHSTPVVSGGVLYIATRTKVYAIANAK